MDNKEKRYYRRLAKNLSVETLERCISDCMETASKCNEDFYFEQAVIYQTEKNRRK